jgi:tetratricopeptide (TPR) repeat protein
LPKKHHPHARAVTPADLKARVLRTRAEGKYQQALELVKQLHKAEPTAENFELLKDTYFRRAGQLRASGYPREAAAVVLVAASLDEKNPAWLEQLAAEMTLCGDVARARQLIARLPPGAASAALNRRLADAALLQEKDGRSALPPELQPEYDAVVQAFKHQEAGRDDLAAAALQAIGLKSPFLEWKLLLRGLQAYYAGDDERARENWQRLDPQRPPARLAAPFRAATDRPYRDAQPPPTQQALAQQFEFLQGSTAAGQLRALREEMATAESLGRAFRLAEQALPALRAQAPHLVGRLAHCMYWAILKSGPDELPRYRRVFAAPPDDPNFSRLEAVAFDEGGSLENAHKAWQRYEREIAQAPQAWPGGQAELARALIWLRMGENAAALPDEAERKKMPAYLREMRGLPAALKPTAVECYEKALALQPDLLDAHVGLFRTHSNAGRTAKAFEAGRRLLARFPDHLAVLEEMADLYELEGEPGKALELLLQALKHNPLDRALRQRVGDAHLACARAAALHEEFEPARAHYASAAQFAEPAQAGVIACCWAACEMKAKNQPRADELLAQAREKAPGEMLLTYVLLVEANRVKLPSSLKTRFTQEFNAAVGDAPTPALAVALTAYLHRLHDSGETYHGQKTHAKKLFEYIDRLDKEAFSEETYVALLQHMARVEPPARMVQRFFEHGTHRYPANPFVPYLQAVHMLGDEEDPEEARDPVRADRLLARAEQLGRPRAQEPAVKAMLDDAASRRKQLQAVIALRNPFANLFSRFAGMGGLEELFGELDPEDFFR